MQKRTRILIGLGFSALVIVLALLILAYHLSTRSFPTATGSLKVRGIVRPVAIERDQFGVPHIFAESAIDAWFAAGFVQAQDRMWQMDLLRRAGEGRLAEILGREALPIDRMFRTLGLRDLAEQTVRFLDAETRTALEAFARGVNAALEEQRGRYAIEFDMLGFEPDPWEPRHTLLLAKLMAWELNTSRWVDITYGYIAQLFGERRARDLYPDWPEAAPTVLPARQTLSAFLQADAAYRRFFGPSDDGSGSNGWVIAPSKSVTGNAVLANDPHLIFTAPARWYEMHLSSPDFDVIGVSIPGVPFVVIGRNRHIAWGMTSAMIDDVDYYVEETDSVEFPTHYRLNDRWVPIRMRTDTILVKDNPPVILTTYHTHRGPVINRIEPAAGPSDRLLSMKWVAGEPSLEVRAIMNLNRARNWREFRSALEDFSAPAQNFLYADAEGNIGYVTGGKIPRRPSPQFSSPYPGWNDRNDWTGFVPFEQNPSAYNPPQGFIVTANNKIVAGDYPYYLSSNWEPPWRAERIVELLGRDGAKTLEDHQRIQLDVLSPQARVLIPEILKAHESVGAANDDVRTALNYFRNWDFQMREESVAGSLFEAFLVEAIHNTFADELGPLLTSLYDTLSSKPMTAITNLLQRDSSDWFDDVRTPASETKTEIITKSLAGAVERLRAMLGGELKEWRWGKIHTVEFGHVFGRNQFLRRLFNVGPLSVGGSHATVWKGDYRLKEPFLNHLGPSMRLIVDMADVNNTRIVVPPGQSGHLFHRNYDNQIPLWRNGAYKQQPMDREKVEEREHQLLILRPE